MWSVQWTRPERGRVLRGALAIGVLVTWLAWSEPAPAAGHRYELVFEDDFEGTVPSPAVWWSFTNKGSLPASVTGGVLSVRSTAGNDYEWGNIGSVGPRSSTEPNYPNALAWEEGYFEARIRYTDSPWSLPAFWLFSQSRTEAFPDEDCSQMSAEWDIMENGYRHVELHTNNWYNTTLHRNTTGNVAGGYCGEPDETRDHSWKFDGVDLSAWHVWSGRWTAKELCTYLDGEQITCMAPFDSTAQPMSLRFSMMYRDDCSGCSPRPDELEMEVDWVRVWQQ